MARVSWVSVLCSWYGDHRDLHLQTLSFPTRRSSDRNNIMHLSRSSSSPFTDPTFSNLSLVVSPKRCAPGLSRTATFSSRARPLRSEEHTSELTSLMRISYAVF